MVVMDEEHEEVQLLDGDGSVESFDSLDLGVEHLSIAVPYEQTVGKDQ
jgi:hypothetical protein